MSRRLSTVPRLDSVALATLMVRDRTLHVEGDPALRETRLERLNSPDDRCVPRGASAPGCCFCFTTEGEMWTTREFDQPVHPKCVRERLAQDPHDQRANLIGAEFGFLHLDSTLSSPAAVDDDTLAAEYPNLAFGHGHGDTDGDYDEHWLPLLSADHWQ